MQIGPLRPKRRRRARLIELASGPRRRLGVAGHGALIILSERARAHSAPVGGPWRIGARARVGVAPQAGILGRSYRQRSRSPAGSDAANNYVFSYAAPADSTDLVQQSITSQGRGQGRVVGSERNRCRKTHTGGIPGSRGRPLFASDRPDRQPFVDQSVNCRSILQPQVAH